ncbi:anti-anti-sigma factor [Roseivivax halodurans JCM 10272]|uniref:Anti-sigma factor antagonist n=1 Tax=Roseivivax halodurans JCM 10272 TaxID=1449350 RepID=X7EGS1_9RHOB|nr:STAS domain-containing protein [Roseivivax halodurans]ETX15132.1 anti-anti-sigma factor [Roseivivax halodurans JCM 10272]
MHLDTETRNGTRLVRVGAPRIDAVVAIEFKDRMREATTGEEPVILLDLEEVEFVDSSGLGAIVAAMKQLGPGRRLDLVNLQPNVDKVFRLTRMDTIFAIHASLEAASGADAR